MKLDREKIKKMFPNLAKELETDENKVAVNSMRTDLQTAEKADSNRFFHYTPDIIDFIRRCDAYAEAEEIIMYLEKRGEIEKQYAERLRKQLAERGVRSFGPKKEKDYYLQKGEL